MNLELKIAKIISLQNTLMEKGYGKEESLAIIQTAAISKISDCISENYDSKPYFRVEGTIATYRQ